VNASTGPSGVLGVADQQVLLRRVSGTQRDEGGEQRKERDRGQARKPMAGGPAARLPPAPGRALTLGPTALVALILNRSLAAYADSALGQGHLG
jgi:hypothetical protein